MIVAVVDEETGGELGAEWITQNIPRRCAATCSSTRARAGVRVRRARRYGVCCAEKGVFRFTVTTDGVAAHASMPSWARTRC